jgi:AcrR family transcriptional regulator
MPRRLLKLRARSADDKELRRASIVAGARALLATADWSELRIADVARRAGVAKPSVFRYFSTKEELVLAVYLEELGAVFAELARVPPRPATDARAAARLLVTALLAHPLFVRLSGVVHAALARRISVESARRFKLALLEELRGAAAFLEALRPRLTPGSGLRLLLRFHAAMIGLSQLADPPPSVTAALAGGGLDAFCIDFAHELEEVFVGLLKMEERP